MIKLPKFYVVAIDKLLSLFFGRLIIRTNNIDATLYKPVRA